MRNQIASEFRKLATTRSFYAMLAGLIAIVGIGVVASTTSIKPTSLVGPLEHQVFLNVVLTIAPLFGLLLGLRSFTDEFRFGSIVPTLLASPVRRRVLGAKLVATAVGGIVLSLAAVAISLAVGVPILIVKGIEITWSTGALAAVVGRLVAATVLWAALGVGLGLAVKHQVAAIAGTLIWLLAAEGILSGLIPNVARNFPGLAGFAVVGINPSPISEHLRFPQPSTCIRTIGGTRPASWRRGIAGWLSTSFVFSRRGVADSGSSGPSGEEREPRGRQAAHHVGERLVNGGAR